MRQVMKNIVLAVIVSWAAMSAITLSAQAAPFGSSQWWHDMDRDGRGGR
jgi:hypothetical protein